MLNHHPSQYPVANDTKTGKKRGQVGKENYSSVHLPHAMLRGVKINQSWSWSLFFFFFFFTNNHFYLNFS